MKWFKWRNSRVIELVEQSSIIIHSQLFEVCSFTTIVENGLANKKDLIKILGRGELKTKVNITAHGFSAKAKSTIEDLGGKAALIEQKKEKVE